MFKFKHGLTKEQLGMCRHFRAKAVAEGRVCVDCGNTIAAVDKLARIALGTWDGRCGHCRSLVEKGLHGCQVTYRDQAAQEDAEDGSWREP